MAKKGRDLFEILRERSGGSRSAMSPKNGGGKTGGSARAREGASAADKVGEMGRGVVDWMKKKVGAEPEPAPRPALSQSGLVLAAVAAVALLLGFVVGRATSGSPSDVQELRREVESGGPQGRGPGRIRGGDAVTERGEEEKILSDLGFLVLAYPALEKQKAADAAVWLRSRGLWETRIRYVQDKDEGDFYFAVITYTEQERAADDLSTLRGLEAPGFDPRLAAALKGVEGPDDVRFERRDG